MKYLFLILFFLFGNCNLFKVEFYVKPNSNRCIGEYLIENTLSLFTIESNSSNIKVKFIDLKGAIIYNKNNESDVKIAYTPKVSGNYQVCIENYDKIELNIEFSYKTGVAAKDYSSIAKQSNLKPMELNLKILEDSLNYLIKELGSSIRKEEDSLEINDTLSDKIVYFSFITLSVMLFVGIAETFYIKKYVERRKYI